MGAYGDSSLWYLIAEANGLSGNSDLRVGQTLSIPNRVTAQSNNASTFKPYDPSRVVGDTSPNLPQPPASGGGGCGGLGQILMVVVAVVVAVYSAGALSGAAGGFAQTMSAGMSVMTGGAVGGTAGLAAATSSTLGVIGTAAAAGAIGSVASQLVGNALGVQQGFNWQNVALSAIGSGIGAGMASMGMGSGPLSGQGLGATVARAAVGNAMSQGIGVVTGLQPSFDWRGVAASAIGASVSYGVGSALKGVDLNQYVKAGIGSFAASVAATAVRGGRVVVQQVAVDALGNALGGALVDNMGRPGVQEDRLVQSSQESFRASEINAQNWDARIQTALSLPGSGRWDDQAVLSKADGWAQVYGEGAIQVADKARFGNGRMSLGQHYVDSTGNRVQVLGEGADPSINSLLQQAQGLANELNSPTSQDTGPALSDAVIESWRQENLARMQTLAAQASTSLNMGASAYETGIYSNDPGSAEYYRQRDGRVVMQMSGLADGLSANAGESISGKELAIAAAQGAVHSVLGILPEATLQTQDVVKAGLSVGYNELVRPFTGGELWLPEMQSNLAQSYAQGTSQTKLILGAVPVLNAGVFSYDTTRALMEGRTRDAAYGLGSFAGGMAVGAGMQRYGNYGVQIGASGLGALGGNSKISLVHPNLLGSGKVLDVNMGGVPAGYQAHHLIMSELASGSSALNYLAKNGLYDVNRASNGRGYPGNPLSAADAGLPLHSGYHGPEYRGAVRTALSELDSLQGRGASDAALLAKVARIESQLAGKLERGQLWLNDTDALHRNLGKYSND